MRSSLDFHRSLMLRWGGVGWGGARCYRHVNICTSLMQKCGERNCQNVEISKLKTSRSPTLGKTNSKLFKSLHFATAKHTFYKKKPSESGSIFRLFLRFQNDSFAIAKTKFGRKKMKPRARFPVRRVVFERIGR